jgi:AcrR family transcriptional regulator
VATDSNSIEVKNLPGTRGGTRRARILTAFHACIIAKGYAKTTLRDVARKADMSASHLLYYFPGKDTMLEHYFENVSQRIVERIESFSTESPEQQIELLSELFFAGKGITRSEIGFMLECFGVAVHDQQVRSDKTKLDRFCKNYLKDLFEQSPAGAENAHDYAEVSYATLIGLRTAAYFDQRLGLPRARELFRNEIRNLAGYSQRD